MDAQPSAAGARTSPSARRPIGEFLVERGLVTPEELAAALQQQRASGKRLGEILVERGAITRMALASVLGEQWEEAGRHLRAVVPVRLADGKEADSGLAGGEELTESLSSLQAAVVRLEELAGEVVDAPRAAPDAGAVGEVVARLERIEAWMQDGAGGALGEQLAAAVEGLGRELAEIKVVLAQPIAADDALAERLGRLEDALEYRPDDTVAERLGALDEWLRSRDDGALGETMRAALEELGGELRALAAREPERDPVLAERLDGIEQALARKSATDARFDRLEALVQEAARSDAGVEPLRAELAELRTAVAVALSPVVEVDARLAGIEEALATRSTERLEERVAELARATGAADETVAERLARIETGLAERPTVEPGGEIVASELAGLRERIDELAARPDRLPPELSHALAELRGSLQMPARDEELHARLDELAGLLAARSVDAPIPAEVAEALAELRERVAAAPRAEELDERLGVLAAAVEAAAAPDGELRFRLERIETALGEISVPEATAGVTAAIAELRERLDAVGEHATAPDLRDALDRIDGRLGQALAPDSELRERLASLESLVASVAERDLGHRLDELHAALQRSAEPDSDVRARLARIETALAERDSDGSFAVFAGALAEVRGGLDELREALGNRETSGADEEVRGRLEHIEQVLDHIPTADVAARVEDLARIVAEVRDAPTRPAEPDHELRERVDRLAAALHEHGADTRVLDSIAALAASLPHALDAGEIGWRVAEVLTPRLERLEAQSGELGQALERLGELQAAPAAEIAERVAAALAGDHEALRALVASVAPHDVAAVAETVVAGLDERLAGLADDLRGRVEGLRSELSARSHEPAAGTIADRVTGALGERLDRLEGAVADRSVEKALAARLETLPDELAGRVREAVPKPPQAGEIAKRVESRLAERLEGIEAAVRERPELELIAGLQARLDGVSSRLSESRDGELLEQLGRIEHELGAAGAAIREDLEGRREQLDGVSAAVGRVDGELARRLDELVGGIEAAVRAAAPHERLTELVERIEGVRSAIEEPRDAAVHERLDAQAAQLAEVREVVARLGSALADRRDDASVERLEELAAKLRDALADPPGAAALTRLMTQSHNALADRLESIESSVASLPPGVPAPQSPPAPPRTAEPVLVPSPSVEPVGPTSYVAIVPSADGYSLVDVDGPLPEPGGTLDLEEAGRPLVVARIGRSPLPGDRRRCAFLEAG